MKRWATLLLLSCSVAVAQTRQDAERCLAEVDAGAVGPACEQFSALLAAEGDDKSTLTARDGAAIRDYALTLPDPEQPAAYAAMKPGDGARIAAAILTTRTEKPKSLWQQFKDWLRQRLLPRQEQDAPDWLKRLFSWITHVPAGAVQAAWWGLLILLVGSLIAILYFELRAAGVLQRQRRSAAAARMSESATVPTLSREELERLAPRLQLAALLRWTLAQLVGRGQLPDDPTLTNRELQRRLPAPAASLLGNLLDEVERVIYGGIEPKREQVAQARALADALVAAP